MQVNQRAEELSEPER